jgi:hypothetical protein
MMMTFSPLMLKNTFSMKGVDSLGVVPKPRYPQRLQKTLSLVVKTPKRGKPWVTYWIVRHCVAKT